MNCIFCTSDSSSSKSVEHIIPESLGNIDHILPKGFVCDKCNNYFSREVEAPFLNHPTLRFLRNDQEIFTKKGVTPLQEAWSSFGIIEHRSEIHNKNIEKAIYLSDKASNKRSISGITRGHLIIPHITNINYMMWPNGKTASRFLAKIAVEAFFHRFLEDNDSLKTLFQDRQLDLIKRHARYGESPNWPFSMRRIYAVDKMWKDENGNEQQILHEFDILITPSSEYYFVLAIFGMEFAINYGGPEIDSYYEWLKQNNNKSHLFTKTNGLVSF